MLEADIIKKWTKVASDILVGRTITEVAYNKDRSRRRLWLA